MMSAETFAFLQQPQIALPICALACAVIALVLRKFWTAGALAASVGLFLLNWQLTFVTGDAAVIFYVAQLGAFFAVATWERAWAVIYVALMPVINWSFAAVPTAAIPAAFGGGQFQPLAIVTGLVLVVRDLAQREIKHWIWGAMIAGLVLSSLTSWIVVVFASGAAFLISETVDWAVYTFSKRPLSQRILLSSVASAPLDQVVFIGLASQIPGQSGIFALGTIFAGIASKLFGAWVVSRIIAAQERRAGVTAPQNDMNPA
ncbi:MAG: hypothetical protein NT015_03445 [Alphaproteobacteria bacterium]|nr:hypothetical protein [Alphaproteobacteria bacterium]